MPVLALTMAFALLSQGPATKVEAKDANLLRAVADAFDANRAGFTCGSVNFEYWDAYANDVSAAIDGRLSDPYEARGTYSFDGKDALYTRLFSTQAMAATDVRISPTQGLSRLSSFRVLTNGESTFTERIGALAVQVAPSEATLSPRVPTSFFRTIEFPLDLARPEALRDDLAQNIRTVLERKGGAEVEAIQEDAVFDEVKTIRIALKFPNGTRTFWVDLEHGAVPVHTRDDVTGGEGIDWHLGDIRFIEGCGWLPHAMTKYLANGRTNRLLIKQATFDNAPPRGTFRLSLDEPRTVADVSAGRAYVGQRTVDLNNLPKSSSRSSVPLGNSVSSGPDPVMPGERRSRPPYFSGSAIAFSLLVFAGVAWRRIRRGT